jgi:transposase InsO family protein
VNCSLEEAYLMVEAIRAAREEAGGHLPQDQFTNMLDVAGIDRKSGYRWLRYGPPTGTRTRYELSERAKTVLVQVHGRRALAYRILADEGEDLPCLRTFQEGVLRSFNAIELAGIEEGDPGFVRMRTYAPHDPTLRNELWQCDTVYLDMLALEHEGSDQWRRPLVTLVVDHSTGAIMGWSVSFSETKQDILVAIREALVVRKEDGPFGGIPRLMTVDQGPSMISNAVISSSVLVGFKTKALPGRHPWLKGAVEAKVGFINEDFSPRFPHFTGGRKDRTGKPQIPSSDPPTLGEVAEKFTQWVRRHNLEHKIERQDGRNGSPLEEWEKQDDVPLKPISRRAAASFLKERETRKVGNGIRLHGLKYGSTSSPYYKGQEVVVAYMPRSAKTIEVFQNGRWLFTAKAINLMEPEEVLDYRTACREAANFFRRKIREYEKRSKKQIAPITGGGEAVEDSEPIPIEKGREFKRARNSEKAAEAAEARLELTGSNPRKRNTTVEVPKPW